MDRDRVIELVEVEILRHEQMGKLDPEREKEHRDVSEALRKVLAVYCA